jgi:DNA-binding response OmpR family regulator
MKILIIEDDKHILSFLTRGFEEDGYVVDSATDGAEGEYLALMHAYDVILLDWMLPSKDGLEILHALRENNINTPTIMLSAKGETKDKVSGLKSGADDYLPKPFLFEELVARVEALYRRSTSKGVSHVNIRDISIDTNSKIVTRDDEVVNLTAKEYELLLFLHKHKNSMVSNRMIEEQLWSYQEYINSNVIQVTIYNLRKKLGKELIESFRGLGYKIEA